MTPYNDTTGVSHRVHSLLAAVRELRPLKPAEQANWAMQMFSGHGHPPTVTGMEERAAAILAPVHANPYAAAAILSKLSQYEDELRGHLYTLDEPDIAVSLELPDTPEWNELGVKLLAYPQAKIVKGDGDKAIHSVVALADGSGYSVQITGAPDSGEGRTSSEVGNLEVFISSADLQHFREGGHPSYGPLLWRYDPVRGREVMQFYNATELRALFPSLGADVAEIITAAVQTGEAVIEKRSAPEGGSRAWYVDPLFGPDTLLMDLRYNAELGLYRPETT